MATRYDTELIFVCFQTAQNLTFPQYFNEIGIYDTGKAASQAVTWLIQRNH